MTEERIWVAFEMYNGASCAVLADNRFGADVLTSILVKEPAMEYISLSRYNPDHPKGYMGELLAAYNYTAIKGMKA